MAAQVDQVAIEPASKGVPGSELDQALLEPAARPLPPSDLLQQVAEPAVRPDPPVRVDALKAESTARPDPPVALLATLIEVVWREPPPRGIFAFRHDWSQPWVERWEWKTQILRSRDGGVCQDSCHFFHAATALLSGSSCASSSCAGLSQTTSFLDQSRVMPDQRSGCLALACS